MKHPIAVVVQPVRLDKKLIATFREAFSRLNDTNVSDEDKVVLGKRQEGLLSGSKETSTRKNQNHDRVLRDKATFCNENASTLVRVQVVQVLRILWVNASCSETETEN